MSNLSTSAAGRAYIIEKEGKRNRAYQDTRGIWTIGIGETGEGIGPGVIWTDEEVDQNFANRLADEFEPAVNDMVGDAPTTQGQFDALVSLAYNIGVNGLKHSTVIREHIAGNYQAAADAFLMWDKSGGRVLEPLTRRREEEAQTYLDASP